MREKIIIASHGAKGARAAEEAALELAAGRSAQGAQGAEGEPREKEAQEAELVHLYVIDSFWGALRGDDWLNNGAAREHFNDYLKKELASEARAEMKRLAQRAREMKIPLRQQVMCGQPAKCLLELAARERASAVFIGQPRRKGETGLRSRMKLEELVRNLDCRLVIVPRARQAAGASHQASASRSRADRKNRAGADEYC
jgi:nucleotide-binding universal stress UspA family protein